MKKYYCFMLFTMLVGSIFAQFTEDFSSGLPATWKVINNGGSSAWSYGNEEMSLKYDFSSHDDYLITPQFTVIANVSDKLKFSSKDDGFSSFSKDKLSVLLSETGTNPLDFTTTIASDIQSARTYEDYEFDLSAYIGKTVYIAFHVTTSFKDEVYVDNVSITKGASCKTPTDVQVTNITDQTASLSWQVGASGESSWEYIVQGSGLNTPTGAGVSANTTIVNLKGLIASTNYDVYVRANCGSGDFSEWTEVLSFKTACGIIASDYSENFDNGLSSLDCWANKKGDLVNGPITNDGTWSDRNYLNSFSQSNAAHIALSDSFGSDGEKDWLISPSFDVSKDAYELTFKIAAVYDGFGGDGGLIEDDEIRLLISQNNGTNWTTLKIWNKDNQPSDKGQEEKVDLRAYKTNPISFAFYATTGTVDTDTDMRVYIEDFAVKVNADLSTDFYRMGGTNILLSPNPTVNKRTQIAQHNFSRKASVKVFTSKGQLVHQQILGNTTTLDLNHLATGFYFVEISDQQHNQILKLIVD